jgi:hypothetical protein
MIARDERNRMIAGIESLPQQLEASIQGLNDQQLDTPYRRGGWTPRQVVHHLADSHMNAYIRLKLVLTENHPTLKPYDQDAWSNLPDAAQPIDASLSILRGLHQRWTAVLRNVPESDWSRTAYHPEIGDVTAEKLLSIYSEHGRNHVGQISSLRKSKGW